MVNKVFLVLFFALYSISYGQNVESKIFYFETGEISSEGKLVAGIPTGLWTSYYKNGETKSVGLWKEGNLDSLWKFYTEEGIDESQIMYKSGLKSGWYKKYSKEGFLLSKEKYVKDNKQGFSYYFKDNRLKIKTRYKADLENGKSYAFDETGIVIGINSFKDGFIKRREKINRKNKKGNKDGRWIEFFECEEPCMIDYRVKWEGRFKNGIKNGIFREYDIKGELLRSTNYVDGEVFDNVVGSVKTELIEERYSNGGIKSIKNFRNGIQHGVSKNFSKDGEIESVEIYEYGKRLGKGSLNEKGIKNGMWEEYYATGELRAKGKYKSGKRVGDWIFFHLNGKVEQRGKFDGSGLPTADWRWFYESGNLQREESFYSGKEEGTLTEYSDSGNVISRGEYLDGEREGDWFYQVGDYKEEGKFSGGQRIEEWKHYYLSNEVVSFKGSYEDGIQNGKHIYYYPSGKKMLEGKYEYGNKHGEWKRYDEFGTITLTIFYKDGVEWKVNNVKIKPRIDG